MPYRLLKAYSTAEALSLGTSRGYTENWARDVVLITAKAAVDTVNELSRKYPEHFVQKAIINRILRGVLWISLLWARKQQIEIPKRCKWA